MAQDDEKPQFNPKHRIAGAIILVSLAVIFVPMLLDKSSPPKEKSLTEIPARDGDTKVVVSPVPLPAAEPAAAPATTPSTPAPVAESAPKKTADSAPVEAPKKATEKKADPAPAKNKPAVAKLSDVVEKPSQGWVVQVGSFTNIENAGHLRDKLKNMGYAVQSDSVKLQDNKAVRLRVGPYRDKTAASKAQAKLEKDFNIHGMVVAYP